MTLRYFEDNQYFKEPVEGNADLKELLKGKQGFWLHLHLNEKEEITKTADVFDIHGLHIEDVFAKDHLPKYESTEQYAFLSLRYFYYSPEKKLINNFPISLILKEKVLITFASAEVDQKIMDEIERRIKFSNAHPLSHKAELFVYLWMDVVVDEYMTAVLKYRLHLEDYEDDMMLSEDEDDTLNTIIEHKRNINYFRRNINALREEFLKFKGTQPAFITKPVLTYFRDIQDHLDYLVSQCENLREIIHDMVDLHFSELSRRMNHVMKVLTMVATIFIPLTFVVGFYGMNLKYLPAENMRNGWVVVTIIMLAMAGVMFWFFKKKRWL